MSARSLQRIGCFHSDDDFGVTTHLGIGVREVLLQSATFLGRRVQIELQPVLVALEGRHLMAQRGPRVKGRGLRVEGRGSRVEGRGLRVEG